jgi:hypothetical protein
MPMIKAGPFARLRHLSDERKRLLLRATWMLGVASAAVALMPFRYAIKLGSVPIRRRQSVTLADIVWAVEAAGKRLPWRTLCIEKGLVAQRLLRQTGVDAILHYGARHHPDTRKLEAHVWVTVDGRALIGGEQAAAFASVASYP